MATNIIKESEKTFSNPLFALYFISLLSGFSMGIFNPLISILMKQHGVGEVLIGANASVYYLSIALFSPFAGKLIRHYGIRWVIFAGIFITAITTTVFPLTDNIANWFFLRVMMGIGICLYMVAGQTGLNLYANSKKRGVIVAIHGAAFGVGFIISPLIGSFLYAHYPQYAFVFGSCVISLGILVVFVLNKELQEEKFLNVMTIFRKVHIALSGVFIYGALEGIVVTLLPVYLINQSIAVELSSLPLPLFMIASGLGMIPVSYFGDKYGHWRILIVSAFTGMATLLFMLTIDNPHAITVGAVLLGLSVGTFFPVTLAMIGNQLSKAEMPTGSALFTASFSYGCAAGPLIAALFMSALGNKHIFSLIIVLLFFLAAKMLIKSPDRLPLSPIGR